MNYKVKICFILLLLLSMGTTVYSQFNWQNRQPVITGGDPDTWNYHVFSPCVLYNESMNRYEMWFGAGYGEPDGIFFYPYQIGFATSFDGITWDVYPNPVLERTAGSWDQTITVAPSVLKINGTYHMWYEGTNIQENEGGMGQATSSDGINWTKDTEHTMLLASDTAVMGSPSVNYSQDQGYSMWYNTWNEDYSTIERATSANGIDWKYEEEASPVLTAGSGIAWDGGSIFPGGRSEMRIDNTYYLWYTGSAIESQTQSIGLATSEDELHWEKYKDPEDTRPSTIESNPVLKPFAGANKGVVSPSIIMEGDSLRMWFAGFDGSRFQIFHASSMLESSNTSVSDWGIANRDNPFNLRDYKSNMNEGSIFEFELEEPGFTTLQIYNSIGQIIVTLVSKQLPTGSYQYEWYPSNLSSGIYFYRLQVGKSGVTKKMIL